MVKGNKSNNKQKKKGVRVAGGQRPRARPRGATTGLDQAALKYRALLLDPCNAEMTNSVYSGLGSGQFRRFRAIIPSAGLSVEGTYVFQLGTNLVYNATHVAGTAGTAYTFNTAGAIVPGLTALGDAPNFRCLAGCVKVRYTGPESGRQGTIGMAVVPAQFLAPGATSSAELDLGRMPFVSRFGEVQHEVKFVPSQVDEEFHVVNTLDPKATCIVINYRGIPASTLQFEVTTCFEIETAGSGVPLTSHVPTSRNTLNHVLQSLGPVSSWAFNTLLAPTIKSVYNAALATPAAGRFASAVAGGIMSL